MYDINEKTAYFFGFFWGDGGMKSKGKPTTPKICIAKNDSDVLAPIFADCFDFNYSEYAQEGRKIRGIFTFKDKNLKKFLFEMDCMDKSFKAPSKLLNLIPSQYHKYFWRGYIDADGCFYKRKSKRGGTFSISSSLDQDWLETETWLKSLGVNNFSIFRKETKSGNSSVIEVKYGPEIKKIGHFIYGDLFDGIGLKRKFNKFQEISNSLLDMTSSKKGVSFHKGIGKWRAYVKRKFLGWWNTEEEAYLARIKFLDQISAFEK